MTDREKLVEIVERAAHRCLPSNTEDFHLNMFVRDLLAHCVVVREWIPVTERLPKLHAEVLVYRRSHCGLGGYMGIEYVTLGHGEACMWSNDFTTYKSAVTHWMPLPEPPKEGE